MVRAALRGALVAGVALVLALPLSLSAQTRRKVGEERAYRVDLGLYPIGDAHRPATWSERVVSPGASFLRVHFSGFRLAPGDYVTVSSPDGKDFWTYTDRGLRGTGEFWSFSVESDTALVELHTGRETRSSERRARYGFVIDRIVHGTEPFAPAEDARVPGPFVVCGSEGRENVACHSDVSTRPVARLSFQSGGSSFVCTGWLVRGSNGSTLLTNNHCVDNQAEVNTVQARFNFQRTTCSGSTTAITNSYAGGTFLRTSSSLDYTLLTLQGNPEATWGEYVATSKAPSTGLTINFPQHPAGGLKVIGFWENSGHTTRCRIAQTGQSFGYATGSQIAYGCDSAGGSSGSPIMDAGTGRIIGLHHLGGVSNSPCLNAATVMSRVCSSAGSLLSCATN